MNSAEFHQAKDATMHVHFVPRWPGNPYHYELADHLMNFGVVVEEASRLKNIFELGKIAGKFPEIVHFHAIPRFSWSPMDAFRFIAFWCRVFRLRAHGSAVVWTIHDIFHHEAKHPKIDLFFSRLLFHRADGVIVHSEAAGRAVKKQWNVQREEGFFVVPHGNYIESYPNEISRDDARTKLGIPHEKLVFLFLGMIRPYKGVVPLIETFKQIANPSSYLLVAGKPLNADLSNEIGAAVGNQDSIHHRLDHIKDVEMQDYLNAADVVVFPYTKALTSGALILAMSFGRACIAPKMGALEDTLDEAGGFLYNPEDSDGLRNAMERAINESTSLPTMGICNLKRVQGWSWDFVAKLTTDVYQRTFGRIRNT